MLGGFGHARAPYEGAWCTLSCAAPQEGGVIPGDARYTRAKVLHQKRRQDAAHEARGSFFGRRHDNGAPAADPASFASAAAVALRRSLSVSVSFALFLSVYLSGYFSLYLST